mgnify:CR=1 FL=1
MFTYFDTSHGQFILILELFNVSNMIIQTNAFHPGLELQCSNFVEAKVSKDTTPSDGVVSPEVVPKLPSVLAGLQRNISFFKWWNNLGG